MAIDSSVVNPSIILKQERCQEFEVNGVIFTDKMGFKVKKMKKTNFFKSTICQTIPNVCCVHQTIGHESEHHPKPRSPCPPSLPRAPRL